MSLYSSQGSKGIRQCQNNKTYNYTYWKLQLVVKTIGHSINQPIKIQ